MFLDNAYEVTITLKSRTNQVVWLIEAPDLDAALDVARLEAPKAFAEGWAITEIKEVGPVKILRAEPHLSAKM